MPRDKANAALLRDMIDAADAVMRYLKGKKREEFINDEILRAAVERRIEIVGEAARALSDDLQTANPHVPWRKIMATRHILAHDYDLVDPEIVWTIATVYIPELAGHLRLLVPPDPPDPEPEN
jgi:uncharacterized protein with HEPN domain